jgi:hypothetical protein
VDDVPVMMQTRCHTDGCKEAIRQAEEGPIVAPFFPQGDPPVYSAECHECGLPVTDITPVSSGN